MSDDERKASDPADPRRPASERTDDELLSECRVETFRAGGPGGQHQNKTETAVRLTHRPSGIVVTARRSRSQSRNRDSALRRLRARLEELDRPEKPRVPTRPTKAARERHLDEKRRRSERKRGRRKPGPED